MTPPAAVEPAIAVPTVVESVPAVIAPVTATDLSDGQQQQSPGQQQVRADGTYAEHFLSSEVNRVLASANLPRADLAEIEIELAALTSTRGENHQTIAWRVAHEIAKRRDPGTEPPFPERPRIRGAGPGPGPENPAKDTGDAGPSRPVSDEPTPPGHLPSAQTAPFDFSRITGIPDGHEVTIRRTNEPVYRNDTRGPEEIFAEGFQPLDINFADLRQAGRRTIPSAFVASSTDQTLQFGTGNGWKYKITAPGGVDVNETFGAHVDFNGFESEITFPGGVRLENIEGAWPIVNHVVGTEFVRNEHFNPDLPNAVAGPLEHREPDPVPAASPVTPAPAPQNQDVRNPAVRRRQRDRPLVAPSPDLLSRTAKPAEATPEPAPNPEVKRRPRGRAVAGPPPNLVPKPVADESPDTLPKRVEDRAPAPEQPAESSPDLPTAFPAESGTRGSDPGRPRMGRPSDIPPVPTMDRDALVTAAQDWVRLPLSPIADPNQLREATLDTFAAEIAGNAPITDDHYATALERLLDLRPTIDEQFNFLEQRGVELPLTSLDNAQLAAYAAHRYGRRTGDLDSEEFAMLLDGVEHWARDWAAPAGEMFPDVLADALGLGIDVIDARSGNPVQQFGDGPARLNLQHSSGNHYDGTVRDHALNGDRVQTNGDSAGTPIPLVRDAAGGFAGAPPAAPVSQVTGSFAEHFLRSEVNEVLALANLPRADLAEIETELAALPPTGGENHQTIAWRVAHQIAKRRDPGTEPFPERPHVLGAGPGHPAEDSGDAAPSRRVSESAELLPKGPENSAPTPEQHEGEPAPGAPRPGPAESTQETTAVQSTESAERTVPMGVERPSRATRQPASGSGTTSRPDTPRPLGPRDPDDGRSPSTPAALATPSWHAQLAADLRGVPTALLDALNQDAGHPVGPETPEQTAARVRQDYRRWRKAMVERVAAAMSTRPSGPMPDAIGLLLDDEIARMPATAFANPASDLFVAGLVGRMSEPDPVTPGADPSMLVDRVNHELARLSSQRMASPQEISNAIERLIAQEVDLEAMPLPERGDRIAYEILTPGRTPWPDGGLRLERTIRAGATLDRAGLRAFARELAEATRSGLRTRPIQVDGVLDTNSATAAEIREMLRQPFSSDDFPGVRFRETDPTLPSTSKGPATIRLWADTADDESGSSETNRGSSELSDSAAQVPPAAAVDTLPTHDLGAPSVRERIESYRPVLPPDEPEQADEPDNEQPPSPSTTSNDESYDSDSRLAELEATRAAVEEWLYADDPKSEYDESESEYDESESEYDESEYDEQESDEHALPSSITLVDDEGIRHPLSPFMVRRWAMDTGVALPESQWFARRLTDFLALQAPRSYTIDQAAVLRDDVLASGVELLRQEGRWTATGLFTLALWMLRTYPPGNFVYAGLGPDTAAISAMLSRLDSRATVIGLSPNDLAPVLSNQDAEGEGLEPDSPLTEGERRSLDRHLDALLSVLPPDRSVVVLDYFPNARGLVAYQEELNKRLDAANPNPDVQLLAIQSQGGKAPTTAENVQLLNLTALLDEFEATSLSDAFEQQTLGSISPVLYDVMISAAVEHQQAGPGSAVDRFVVNNGFIDPERVRNLVADRVAETRNRRLRAVLVLERPAGQSKEAYRQLAEEYGLHLVMPAGDTKVERGEYGELESETGWLIVSPAGVEQQRQGKILTDDDLADLTPSSRRVAASMQPDVDKGMRLTARQLPNGVWLVPPGGSSADSFTLGETVRTLQVLPDTVVVTGVVTTGDTGDTELSASGASSNGDGFVSADQLITAELNWASSPDGPRPARPEVLALLLDGDTQDVLAFAQSVADAVVGATHMGLPAPSAVVLGRRSGGGMIRWEPILSSAQSGPEDLGSVDSMATAVERARDHPVRDLVVDDEIRAVLGNRRTPTLAHPVVLANRLARRGGDSMPAYSERPAADPSPGPLGLLLVPIRHGATATERREAARLWLTSGAVRPVVQDDSPTVPVRLDDPLQARTFWVPPTDDESGTHVSVLHAATLPPDMGFEVWVNRYRSGTDETLATVLLPEDMDWSVLDNVNPAVADTLTIEPGEIDDDHLVSSATGRRVTAAEYLDELAPSPPGTAPTVILTSPYPPDAMPEFVRQLGELTTVVSVQLHAGATGLEYGFDLQHDGQVLSYPGSDGMSSALDHVYATALTAVSTRTAYLDVSSNLATTPDSTAALVLRRGFAAAPAFTEEVLDGWISISPEDAGSIEDIEHRYPSGLVTFQTMDEKQPGSHVLPIRLPARFVHPVRLGKGQQVLLMDLTELIRAGAALTPAAGQAPAEITVTKRSSSSRPVPEILDEIRAEHPGTADTVLAETFFAGLTGGDSQIPVNTTGTAWADGQGGQFRPRSGADLRQLSPGAVTLIQVEGRLTVAVGREDQDSPELHDVATGEEIRHLEPATPIQVVTDTEGRLVQVDRSNPALPYVVSRGTVPPAYDAPPAASAGGPPDAGDVTSPPSYPDRVELPGAALPGTEAVLLGSVLGIEMAGWQLPAGLAQLASPDDRLTIAVATPPDMPPAAVAAMVQHTLQQKFRALPLPPLRLLVNGAATANTTRDLLVDLLSETEPAVDIIAPLGPWGVSPDGHLTVVNRTGPAWSSTTADQSNAAETLDTAQEGPAPKPGTDAGGRFRNYVDAVLASAGPDFTVMGRVALLIRALYGTVEPESVSSPPDLTGEIDESRMVRLTAQQLEAAAPPDLLTGGHGTTVIGFTPDGAEAVILRNEHDQIIEIPVRPPAPTEAHRQMPGDTELNALVMRADGTLERLSHQPDLPDSSVDDALPSPPAASEPASPADNDEPADRTDNNGQWPAPYHVAPVPADGDCLRYALIASDPIAILDRLYELGDSVVESTDVVLWLTNPEAVRQDALAARSGTPGPQSPLVRVAEAIRGRVERYLLETPPAALPLAMMRQFRASRQTELARELASPTSGGPTEALTLAQQHGPDWITHAEFVDPGLLRATYLSALGTDDAATAHAVTPIAQLAYLERHGIRLPLTDLTQPELARYAAARYGQSSGSLNDDEVAMIRLAVQNWNSEWVSAGGETFPHLLSSALNIGIDVVDARSGTYAARIGDQATRFTVQYEDTNHYSGTFPVTPPATPEDVRPLTLDDTRKPGEDEPGGSETPEAAETPETTGVAETAAQQANSAAETPASSNSAPPTPQDARERLRHFAEQWRTESSVPGALRSNDLKAIDQALASWIPQRFDTNTAREATNDILTKIRAWRAGKPDSGHRSMRAARMDTLEMRVREALAETEQALDTAWPGTPANTDQDHTPTPTSFANLPTGHTPVNFTPDHDSRTTIPINPALTERDLDWVAMVNPARHNGGEGLTNCVLVSTVIDDIAATNGNQINIAPPTTLTPAQHLLAYTNGPLLTVPTGPAGKDAVTNLLTQAGPGARGIVVIREQNKNIAHAFNAINHQGEPLYLDGQTGDLATWPDNADAHFLPTNINPEYLPNWPAQTPTELVGTTPTGSDPAGSGPRTPPPPDIQSIIENAAEDAADAATTPGGLPEVLLGAVNPIGVRWSGGSGLSAVFNATPAWRPVRTWDDFAQAANDAGDRGFTLARLTDSPGAVGVVNRADGTQWLVHMPHDGPPTAVPLSSVDFADLPDVAEALVVDKCATVRRPR